MSVHRHRFSEPTNHERKKSALDLHGMVRAAQQTLMQAGFEIVNESQKSESVYLGLSDYRGVLRLAAHTNPKIFDIPRSRRVVVQLIIDEKVASGQRLNEFVSRAMREYIFAEAQIRLGPSESIVIYTDGQDRPY
jgi:hypothetical protein